METPDNEKQELETRINEFTKARSRVTANTPCPFRTPHLSLEPRILNILIKMENDANSKYTIHFTQKALIYLAKHTSVNDPEQVKTYIAHINASNGYKRRKGKKQETPEKTKSSHQCASTHNIGTRQRALVWFSPIFESLVCFLLLWEILYCSNDSVENYA